MARVKNETGSWQIVERLLEQIEGTTGRLVMAVAPEPLDDVVLYEAPVRLRSQPPQNPLRGFIQEAVLLLDQPMARDIAALLYLPLTVVELVLGNLQQMEGANCDTAGRWSVPDGAPKFGTGGSDPPIGPRTRKLLCYWPKHQVLLPVLPRMRLRDMVELKVHNLQGDFAEWYRQIVSWSKAEGLKRGRSETLCLFPLRGASVPPTSESSATTAMPDTPVSEEEILVTRCRLDVIALTWSSRNAGVWEVHSRWWSRPTPSDASGGEPFAPGEPLVGLSLLEKLLSGNKTLDALGTLFNSKSEAWRNLLDDQEGRSAIRRDLEGDSPALLVADQPEVGEKSHWRGIATRLGPEVRLLCWMHPPPSSPDEISQAK